MQQNIKNSAKINGLIIGGLISLKFLLSAQQNMILSFLALTISIMIIVVLYKTAIAFRDKMCNGEIQYKQAFSYIFQMYFLGTIIASLTILIYTQLIDKVLLEISLNETLKMYKTLKIMMDDRTIELLTLIHKPAPYALVNLLGGIIGGAFWGLILASFVKKNKPLTSKQVDE